MFRLDPETGKIVSVPPNDVRGQPITIGAIFPWGSRYNPNDPTPRSIQEENWYKAHSPNTEAVSFEPNRVKQNLSISDYIKRRTGIPVSVVASHGWQTAKARPDQDYIDNGSLHQGVPENERRAEQRSLMNVLANVKHKSGESMTIPDALRYLWEEKGNKNDVLISACNQSNQFTPSFCDSIKARTKQSGQGVFVPAGKTIPTSEGPGTLRLALSSYLNSNSLPKAALGYFPPGGDDVMISNNPNITAAMKILKERWNSSGGR